MAIAESLVEFKKTDSRTLIGKGRNSGEKERGGSSSKMKWKVEERDWERRRPRDLKCYFCSGPHYARECPKREKLAVMMADSSSEDEGEAKLGSLRVLSAMKG